MPKQPDQGLQEVVALLPATGEVLYDDWKQQIVAAGLYAQLSKTRTAKQQGLVNYRLQTNEDGSQSLFVSRVAAASEGVR